MWLCESKIDRLWGGGEERKGMKRAVYAYELLLLFRKAATFLARQEEQTPHLKSGIYMKDLYILRGRPERQTV